MNPAYNMRPIPSARAHKRRYKGLIATLVVLLVIMVLMGSYVAYALYRPLPALTTTVLPPVLTAQVKVNIPWPATGQAAFGAQGYGLLDSHGITKPAPTASVAKVITALAVLSKHPLHASEQGPAITMTDHDVALYNQYAAGGGSVVPVYEGQKISEYQALQAMMLPSANNIADSLAVWAFGSLPAYSAYANTMVRSLGMQQTTVGSDASGFSPTTVSTAADLVRLGDKALKEPALAEIVNQPSANFPDYGTIDNVNTLLGQYGIRGIKTGNTDEAGGCYLAAADVTVAGQKITVITAIMGSSTRGQAMRDSVPMIQSAVSQFHSVPVVSQGQSVGTVKAAWGASSDIVATSGVTALTWAGTSLAPTVHAHTVHAPVEAGSSIGSLSVTDQLGTQLSTPLQVKSAVGMPTTKWRLLHPL